LNDLRSRNSLNQPDFDNPLFCWKVRTTREPISKNGYELKSYYPFSGPGFDEIAKEPLPVTVKKNIRP